MQRREIDSTDDEGVIKFTKFFNLLIMSAA